LHNIENSSQFIKITTIGNLTKYLELTSSYWAGEKSLSQVFSNFQ